MSSKSIIVFLILGESLFSEVGCQAILNGEKKECSEATILTQKSNIADTPSESYIAIGKDMLSVKTKHLDNNITIVRASTKLAPTCPPFCIEPLTIEGVKSVAELETLSFIKKAHQKKGRLLIDVRENKRYKKETIPSAINLPYSMIDEKSPYRKEVLKLLGAVIKLDKKWYFKNVQLLLIFGESFFSPEASSMIKELIKLGYPKDKILYYRGGIQSWKLSGLLLL